MKKSSYVVLAITISTLLLLISSRVIATVELQRFVIGMSNDDMSNGHNYAFTFFPSPYLQGHPIVRDNVSNNSTIGRTFGFQTKGHEYGLGDYTIIDKSNKHVVWAGILSFENAKITPTKIISDDNSYVITIKNDVVSGTSTFHIGVKLKK